METVTLKIEGMHCDSCAETIRATLRAQPGTQASDVSYREGTARILYDPAKTNKDHLIAVIEKGGYRVSGPKG